MKKPNPTLIKCSLAAAFLVIALNGCDGEGTKSGAEVVDPPKLAEAMPEAPVINPTPVATESVNPGPSPVSQAPTSVPPQPSIVLSNDNSGLVNIAKGKVATESGDYDTSAGMSKASMAVDGNVDGVLAHRSVTTTTENPNAWLDIDLGVKEKIDHIVIWNITDCCSDRLQNYWIFISDKPFSAADTVDKLKKTKGVKAIRGEVANPSFTTAKLLVEGRYVRVQLDGAGRLPQQSYLHLAEVEIYRAK